MADLARQMFRDCTYDLKEISQCRDCYRFATENPSKYWYCKPCRPFHDLVYARQKGCSFWPAKVIRQVTNGDSYDVRFFGGYHQRAVVDKASIRPITVNVHSLGVKRSSLWNKACDELRKHQEFVTKVKSTMPDFLQDCYGDPFTSSPDILEFANSLEESDNENEDEGALDEAAKEELEQIKSALEEEDGSSKLFSQTSVPPGPPIGLENDSASGSPAKKKRRGRPPSNKHKKEIETNGLEENMVSSSSQEPRVASIAVQTPSKLLKDLVQGSGKISKDELRQLKEKVFVYCFEKGSKN